MNGPADSDLLKSWRNDLDALPFWLPRRNPVSPEQFEREFRDHEASSTHVRFMIEAAGRTVGTVYSYNYSALHGWAYLALYLEPQSRRQGLGSQAAGEFISWLFANYPLRKLYAEVFGFNTASLAAWRSAGIGAEAVLGKHHFWGGEYHDLHIFAITRENYNNRQLELTAAFDGKAVRTA